MLKTRILGNKGLVYITATMILFFGFTMVGAQPSIRQVQPIANEQNVALDAEVVITFSEAMDEATASASAIRVYGSMRGYLAGKYLKTDPNTIRFTPDQYFKPGEVISVWVTPRARNVNGIAVAKPWTYTFGVKAGPAPLTFANPNLVSIGSVSMTLKVADFDNDGDTDVITHGIREAPTIRMNNGSGKLTTAKTGSVPGMVRICIADFDGDGDMDAAGTTDGQGIYMLTNDGKGTLTASLKISANHKHQLYAADLNGDGAPDIVYNDNTTMRITIAFNDGAGNFTQQQDLVGSYHFRYMESADFDNDGDVDLVYGDDCNGCNYLNVWLNDGDGNYTASSPVYVWTNNIVVSDVNRDGFADIITHYGHNNYEGVVLVNDRHGLFSKEAGMIGRPDVGMSPSQVKVADLDGDLDMDLVFGKFGSTLAFTLNDGYGAMQKTDQEIAVTSSTNPPVHNNTTHVEVADMDGDEDLDIVTCNGSVLSVLLNGGTQIITTPPALSLSYAGDSQAINIKYGGNWSATTDQSWLTLDKQSGTGNGSIRVQASPHDQAVARSGLVTVADGAVTRTIKVQQLAAPITLQVSTSLLQYSAQSGAQDIVISSNGYTAVETDVNWLMVEKEQILGDRTVNVYAYTNGTGYPRTATLTVTAGTLRHIIKVQQDPQPPRVYGFFLSALPVGGGQAGLSIESNTDWQIHASDDWYTLSATSGSGDQTLTISAPANNTVYPRSSVLTLTAGDARYDVTLWQYAGITLVLEVTPDRINWSADAQEQTVTVTGNAAWEISVNNPWLTVTPQSGTGNATLTLAASANTLNASNTAMVTIQVKGLPDKKTVQVNQSRSYISPNTLNFPARGGEETFATTYRFPWSVSTEENWLKVDPATSTNGPGVITVMASTNPFPIARSGKVKFSYESRSQWVYITQEAARLEVSQSDLYFSEAGGESSITIDANVDWQIVQKPDWITWRIDDDGNSVNLALHAEQFMDQGCGRTDVVRVAAGNIIRDITIHQSLPLPNKPLITSADALVFCAGSSATLHAPADFASYRWSNGKATPSIVAEESGMYTVRVIDGKGCESEASDPVSIVVHALPPRPERIDIIDRNYLKVIGATPYYEWRKDNVVLPLRTQVIPLDGPGIYTARALSPEGCYSAAPSEYEFFVTGVAQPVDEQLAIFPNPSAGIFTIQGRTDLVGAKVMIYDSMGALIFAGDMHARGNTQRIDLTSKPDGVYTVFIRKQHTVIHQKIVLCGR